MTAAALQTQIPENLRILIVEDSKVFREIIQASLSAKHLVTFAADTKEAWEQYLHILPHIVFLDIHLPNGSGHDLARLIKKQSPSTYIVMATGSRRIMDKIVAAHNHVDGFIVKPFQSKAINDCVDRYLTLRRKKQ